MNIRTTYFHRRKKRNHGWIKWSNAVDSTTRTTLQSSVNEDMTYSFCLAYFSFRLDGFGLSLVQLADALTPPQDVAHTWVASAHHDHRYQIRWYHEDDVVSAKDQTSFDDEDPNNSIAYIVHTTWSEFNLDTRLTWNLAETPTARHPARRICTQHEFLHPDNW